MAVIVDARWVIAVAVAGVVGLAAGAVGLAGRPDPMPTVVPIVGAVASTVAVLDCPGGSPIGSLAADDRVLIIARSSDGQYLAVRSPGADYETVWIKASAVDGEPGTVPVDDCVHPEPGR